MCRPVSSRFLPVSSVEFSDRLERAGLFAWLPVLRAARYVCDRLNRADPYSPDYRFLVQLNLVRHRLKSVDLYSSGFLFLVQFTLVRRSTEARRLTRLTLNSKLAA